MNTEAVGKAAPATPATAEGAGGCTTVVANVPTALTPENLAAAFTNVACKQTTVSYQQGKVVQHGVRSTWRVRQRGVLVAVEAEPMSPSQQPLVGEPGWLREAGEPQRCGVA